MSVSELASKLSAGYTTVSAGWLIIAFSALAVIVLDDVWNHRITLSFFASNTVLVYVISDQRQQYLADLGAYSYRTGYPFDSKPTLDGFVVLLACVVVGLVITQAVMAWRKTSMNTPGFKLAVRTGGVTISLAAIFIMLEAMNNWLGDTHHMDIARYVRTFMVLGLAVTIAVGVITWLINHIDTRVQRAYVDGFDAAREEPSGNGNN